MKLSFPHTDLLIEHLAQGTKVSSILFDHERGLLYHDVGLYVWAAMILEACRKALR